MNIRPFPRRLRAALKFKAGLQGKTLAELVIDVLGEYAKDVLPDWKEN